MKQFDLVAKTTAGELMATFKAEDDVPTSLLMGAVLLHEQVQPHARALGLDRAETLLVTTPSRLDIPPGFTIVFPDGVRVVGPIRVSQIVGVPQQFAGRKLTHGLAVAVVYREEPTLDDINDEDDEEPEVLAPVIPITKYSRPVHTPPGQRINYTTPGYNGTFAVN
jgi:hypothetical protein